MRKLAPIPEYSVSNVFDCLSEEQVLADYPEKRDELLSLDLGDKPRVVAAIGAFWPKEHQTIFNLEKVLNECKLGLENPDDILYQLTSGPLHYPLISPDNVATDQLVLVECIAVYCRQELARAKY